MRTRRAFAAAAAALVISACSNGANNAPLPAALQPPDALQPAHRHASSGKIQHVVIIVQENRSFNDLLYGFPGATTQSYGYDSSGDKINLVPIPLETRWDLEHDSNGFFEACNGTGSIPGTDCQMNGFNNEFTGCYPSQCPYAHPQYGYVPHSETKPYFDMGKQYVVADQMYASNLDASSFISHQYIIAGQAGGGTGGAVNFPYGAWGCPGGPGDKISKIGPDRQVPYGNNEVVCWDPTTLGDELDSAKISWAFYATSYSSQDPGIWSAYQAVKHIYDGPDWKNDVLAQPSQILTDVKNGNLRTVSWVTPTWTNSDHAGSGSNTGPSWVSSVVNTIGQSQYWKSTAIFIFWDDYGGWFDPEAPAYVDYDGLGMRLPLIIVSPYAKKHYVSETHLEHGSILKFVEQTFNLPAMTASDKRANAPDDAFDFNKPPRKFKVIPSMYNKEYFLHQPPDYHLPDDN